MVDQIEQPTDQEPRIPAVITSESRSAPLTSGVQVIEHGRSLHMYKVTKAEIRNLVEVGNSRTIDVSWCVATGSFFAAFLIVLLTAKPADRSKGDFFVFMTIIFGIAMVYFGVRALASIGKANAAVSDIENQSDDTNAS